MVEEAEMAKKGDVWNDLCTVPTGWDTTPVETAMVPPESIDTPSDALNFCITQRRRAIGGKA